ncbi:MotA/TolQ/ExbB proton channel family protein [Pelagibius sp.]|uniref:MotA/TolQ/ExbB proton channel family protein n=1 Tax=Pelagibius sp. TaxID=1931238 RepID=UPI003BB21CDA
MPAVDGEASPADETAGTRETSDGDMAPADRVAGDAALSEDGVSETSTPAAEIGIDAALDLLQAGGPVVMILIAMSVLATAVILLKLWQFSRTNVGRSRNGRKALHLYKEGKTQEALAAAKRARSPVGEVLARAIRGLEHGVPESKIREELLRYGGEVLENLRGGFRILEVIASLAPLLGLFGTVLGMIEAFRQLEAAGNQVNPAILSGGIWQALLTTAVGLAVAIPVVAVLNWLERRVDGLAHEMDNLVTQLFTEDLSEDALKEKDAHDERSGPAATAAAE